MSAAVKPDFFQNLPTFVKEQKAREQNLSSEEQALFALSNHDGWLILKEYAESLITDLDQATAISMSQGLSLEEIGKNAVVSNIAKGLILRILQKVDDARETVGNATI